jgi:hypothetical protein
MICSYCHSPISDGARYCEHCGAFAMPEEPFNQKNKMMMVILVLFISLNFLFTWLTFISGNIIPSTRYTDSFNKGVFLLGDFSLIIIYLLYMKIFKAKIWEKVIFFVLIIFLFWPIAYWFFPNFYNRIMSVFLSPFFVISSTLFLTIFFILRLRTNRFLWLLITGHFINGFTSITGILIFQHYPIYFQSYVELRKFFILIQVYENIGSIFLLMFAVTVFVQLINSKVKI